MSAGGCPARAHDIPNQRVDRSIQAVIRPGKLVITYEVSLAELTLTQDLRTLIGTLPGAGREEWLTRYGHETGPLNAKGFLITCEGLPVPLSMITFDCAVEEHPRYTFHFEGELPRTKGRLVIQDTNFASSEGTSRLAVAGMDGVRVRGDALPTGVEEIEARPVVLLTDEEERRTKRVEVDFESVSAVVPPAETSHARPGLKPAPGPKAAEPPVGLTRLLDRGSAGSWLGLVALAAALGALHAVQPGHGKTVISAYALGPGAAWYQPAVLGAITTLAHTSSVLVLAVVLWITGASQVASLHHSLTQAAGFAIAAMGFWRIGRSLTWRLAGSELDQIPVSTRSGSLIGLGLAGGLVPCWEAVGLLILSAATGRLMSGIVAVVAFSAGMGAVLVALGIVAGRLRSLAAGTIQARRWGPRLDLAGGLLLAIVGLAFFLG